jgi:hypothetical protein
LLKRYFNASSEEEKELFRSMLIERFGFAEKDIDELETLHCALYERMNIPSKIKDKEEYLRAQFTNISQDPKMKEAFTAYWAKVAEAVERVYENTKSKTGGQADYFDFGRENISDLLP